MKKSIRIAVAVIVMLVALAGWYTSTREPYLSEHGVREYITDTVAVEVLEIDSVGASKTRKSDNCRFSWAKIKLFKGSSGEDICRLEDDIIEFRTCMDTTGKWSSWRLITNVSCGWLLPAR